MHGSRKTRKRLLPLLPVFGLGLFCLLGLFRISGFRVCSKQDIENLAHLERFSQVIDLSTEPASEDADSLPLVLYGADAAAGVFPIEEDVYCTLRENKKRSTSPTEVKERQEFCREVLSLVSQHPTPQNHGHALLERKSDTASQVDALCHLRLSAQVQQYERLKQLFGFTDEGMQYLLQAVDESLKELPAHLKAPVNCVSPKECAQEAYAKMHRVWYEKGILPLSHTWSESPQNFDFWFDRMQIHHFMERMKTSKKIQGPSCMEIDRAPYVARYFVEVCTDIHVLHFEPEQSRWRTAEGNHHHGDIHDLSSILPPSSLDSFVCTQSLQFFRDPKRALSQIFQALKPGGSLILTAPFVSPREAKDQGVDSFRFTVEAIRTLLASTGFLIVEASPLGSLASSSGVMQGMSSRYWSTEDFHMQDPVFYNLVVAHALRPVS